MDQTSRPADTTGEVKDDKDIILEAIANFDAASLVYASSRSQAREDLKYVAGMQSTANPQDPYNLQANMLGPFLRQITAEARSANPAIRVVPQDMTDIEVAEARGGLIRAIEQQSDAAACYQNALWYAAAAGEGYFVLDTEYISDDSFDQNLKICRVPNPEMIFLDPNHEDPTGEDAEWGFIIKDISHASYKRQFPSSDLVNKLGTMGWNRLGLPKQWITDTTIRIAQYWVKQYRMKKLWLAMNPLTGEQISMDTKPGDEFVLLRKEPREVQVCEVKGFSMNGLEVLEKIDWPGARIPIFKVTGDSIYVGGQLIQYGAVRHAIDSQRQYNYAVSRQTELVDLAPKSPWIITTKQLGNNGEKWANANRISYGYLDYTNENGAVAPYKTSGINSNDFQAVLQTRQQAYEDMKRVFGLNDASMGAVSKGSMSGVAIDSQVEQGSRSTYQYFDNLLLSIKALGREINNLIPYFYDTDRIVRIVKPTNEDQVIAINSIKNDKRYDFTKGQFSISVETGPAYASKRQEAFNSLSSIMGVVPEPLRASIADLVASQIDSPIAKLVAARFKATIPPEILAATGEGDDSDMAPREQLQEAQAKLAQVQQQLKMLELDKKEMEVRVKVAEDKTAMELTELQMNHELKTNQMAFDRELAEVETKVKVKEIQLAVAKLKLARDQLELQASLAMHTVNESTKPVKLDNVTNDLDDRFEVNIGGKMD